MMSFLRRRALKSVMAAMKESVGKCAGPLQHGVGRPDGADTMISLLPLISRRPSRNVSRRAMLNNIEHTDRDLAAVFSRWYTGTTEHRMHFESSYAKISANSGVDQGCPRSACGSAAAIDPVTRFVLADICRLLGEVASLLLTSVTVPLDQATVSR